jgi:hypothetical protein
MPALNPLDCAGLTALFSDGQKRRQAAALQKINTGIRSLPFALLHTQQEIFHGTATGT